MSEGLIVSALVVAVLLGVGSAAFLVMRSPAFWGDVGKELFAKAWPQIWAVLSRQETVDIRRARQRCERMGGEWDHIRKRCKNR